MVMYFVKLILLFLGVYFVARSLSYPDHVFLCGWAGGFVLAVYVFLNEMDLKP